MNTSAGSTDPIVAARLEEARGLHTAGRLSEAAAVYQALLEEHPTQPDALHRFGLLHLQGGRPELAETLIRQAIEHRPGFMRAHCNLGAVLMAREQPAAARECFEHALGLAPEDDDARFNLGTACQALGELDAAAGHYRAVLVRRPELSDARINLGTCLREIGDAQGALDVLSEAVRRDPAIPHAHYNLGVALRDTGQLEAAAQAFRQALALAPEFVDAAFNLANTCNDRGDLEAAERGFRDVLGMQPENARAHFALGTLLRESGRIEAATQALSRARALDAGNADVAYALALTRLQAGEAAGALELLEETLDDAPGSTRELSLKAVALHMLGETAAAGRLVDLERFVHAASPRAPASYPDMETLNADLADHVQGHPTLMPSPAVFTTRNGKHTLELFEDEVPAVRALRELIEAEVDAYLRAHPRDPEHPFLREPPARWRLTGWAVVMHSQGHQVPHVHPGAWLSGVYYVQVPRLLSGPGEGDLGWIEFGRPEAIFPLESPPPLRRVRPEPGTLVLFPGYVYHCTVPLNGEVGEDERRISIAFDVVPAE